MPIYTMGSGGEGIPLAREKPKIPKIYWGRVAASFSLLGVILIVGIWTAKQGLSDWSAMLLHSFELALGLILGLLGGELTANR